MDGNNVWAARASARGGGASGGAAQPVRGRARPRTANGNGGTSTNGMAQPTPVAAPPVGQVAMKPAQTGPPSNVWEARRLQAAAASKGVEASVGGAGDATAAAAVQQQTAAQSNAWDVRKRALGAAASGNAPAQQQAPPAASGGSMSTDEKKPVPESGNVWEARRKIAEMSVGSPNKGSPTSGLSTSQSAAAAPTRTAPVASKENMTMVQEITPKLSLIADVDTTDINKVRPFRPKAPVKRTFQEIPVIANHFPVKFNPKTFPKVVFHYDVVITPKEMRERTGAAAVVVEDPAESTVPDRLLHIIWHEFERRFNKQLGARMPFDGKKNCYTAKPLNLGNNNAWSDEITMVDPDDDDKKRTYKIQLKLANEISTASMFTYLKTSTTWDYCELPQDVIQALDVALRYCPSIHYTPCNRSFYSSVNPHKLSDLLELWFGHNQSLLLGRDERATLNVDMANKAFLKRLSVPRVIMIMFNMKNEQALDKKYWRQSFFRDAETFLKGKLLEYGTGRCINGTYDKKHRFVAVRVMEHSASEYKFTMKGESITIQQYFEREKGITLRHPEWPVVHVGNRNMTNYCPLELCYVVPQAYKGKLEAQDTSEMIKGAAKPPKDRFTRIKNSRANCKFEECQILKEFGIDVGKSMITIETALKLPKPSINCKNERGNEESNEPKGNDGKFNVSQFLKGAEVPKIGILNACGKLNDIFREMVKKDFLPKIGSEALRLGMVSKDTGRGREPVNRPFVNAELQEVKAKIVRGGNMTEVPFHMACRELLKRFKDGGCGLVIVIMGKDGNEYATIKNEAEVQVGVLTQCIKESTLYKIQKNQGAKQVLINILLKVNAKLNGINFQLGRSIIDRYRFQQEPILILGADVTHPAPHSKSPSVAAITASYDLSGVCFQMHIQVQPAAEEVITGIKETLVKMIRTFIDKNGRGPSRIIMFRDGVSEGQFPMIKEKEYRGIIDACRAIDGNWKPRITFLIVKKRHHTRFLPTQDRNAVMPKMNIPPGTLVDTVITHPTEEEFFLNSHVGIQGTSKPTRYHVIHDDSKFAMEDLEFLTYCLCYTFVRCTQPVSYPAPTYYAHLAAFRARALLDKEGDNADLDVLQRRMTIHPDLSTNYPMFYV